MNWIKELRTSCGLAQTQLCNWLQVPQSTLAMAETRQRMLPSEAHLKLTRLVVAMQSQEAIAAAKREKQAALADWQIVALRKKLSYEAGGLRMKAHGLKKKIDVMEQRQQERVKLRVLLAALGILQKGTAPSENDTRWQQRCRENLQGAEQRENDFEWRLLKLRLSLAEQEAAMLEEMVRELEVV